MKELESAEDTALREIKEETGLMGKIIKKGKMFTKPDKKLGRIWVIMPFLCSVKSRKVKLDKENQEYRWVHHKDIKDYPTVPGLRADLAELGLK